MRVVVALLVLASVAFAVSVHEQREFDRFVKTYARSYATQREYVHRRAIFAHNLRRIVAVNADDTKTYTLGVNAFTDLTWDEFKATHLMAPQQCSATTHFGRPVVARADPPATKDWRDAGVVSQVKDQGNCGSCWTFSTTGAVESAAAIARGGDPPLLSEQQLIDCAQAFGNNGCNGGLPSQAFQYIMYAKTGLETEDAYPYEAQDNQCRYDASKINTQLLTQVNITSGDETSIVAAVGTIGPVSVCFDVQGDFQSYSGGVYSSDACPSDTQSVNHAVLAVGYNHDQGSGMDYWIIKNSWGGSWGLDGYFWMQRGVNMCGVAACASFPTAAKA